MTKLWTENILFYSQPAEFYALRCELREPSSLKLTVSIQVLLLAVIPVGSPIFLEVYKPHMAFLCSL